MNIYDKSNTIESINDRNYYTGKLQNNNQCNKSNILANVSFNNLNKMTLNPQDLSNPSPRADAEIHSTNHVLKNIGAHNNSLVAKNEEEEFRGTLKKVPKISKKLPSAFANIFQKSSSNISNNKYIH